MVRKFTVECDFNGTKMPVTFFIGESADKSHPIQFQSKWLSSVKGGKVPEDLMDTLAELKKVSEQNRVSFTELCAYVLEEAKTMRESIEEHKKVNNGLALEAPQQQKE